MSDRKTNKRTIFEHLAPLVEDLGLALLDVLYVHEGGRTVLRLIIDKRGGVGIEDCEQVSQMADPYISDQLGLDDFEVFEVSSPGLDRPLKTMEDFIRHEGALVRLSLYRAVDGQKKFLGRLLVSGDTVGVISDQGEEHLFPLADIASVKREIVF